MSASTDEQMLAHMLSTPPDEPHARRSRVRPYALALGALLAALLLAGWLLRPVLLWAYDVERAGALMEQGMAWPAPRLVDSQPQARDAAALERAQAYLDDAIRRRPAHPHAYRLAGQIAAARGEWERAAKSFERAAALAPDNPLPRWEASLAYAQMQRVVARAPRTPIVDALAGGQLRAPGQIVKSLFCNDQGATSCYTGRTTYDLAKRQEAYEKAQQMINDEAYVGFVWRREGVNAMSKTVEGYISPWAGYFINSPEIWLNR